MRPEDGSMLNLGGEARNRLTFVHSVFFAVVPVLNLRNMASEVEEEVILRPGIRD